MYLGIMSVRNVPSRKSGKRGGIKGLAKGGARRHRDPPRGEPVVFVDCPDPDNFVLVVAANLLRGCTRVVLTGRPANFGVASRPFSVRTCARAADEVDVAGDSVLALRATAAHLRSVAASQGCSDLKIYDGGVAPDAPVAHAEHVHEFLFGRSDLGESDQGVLTIEAYRKVVADLDAEADRGPALRALLEARVDDLLPLSSLVEDLDGKVECLVGGPFTALAELCDDDAFRDKVLNVRAMACAWDSRNNLFANQFNVGADLEAATFVLGKGSELTCTRTLYTTDFCKAVLTISMEEVAAAASPRLAALYRLWDALTGNRGSVTIFDVAPLLGALADDGHMSLLVPAECSLEDGVFRLEESIGRCGVWATARAAGSVRAALLDMLRRCAAVAAKRAREGDDGAGPSPKAARSNPT